MGFTGKTIIERKNSKQYILRSELSFESEKYKVTVSDGLLTDGCTIPKIFQPIIGSPFLGKYVGSSIIHDGLYATHKLPRKECDEFFVEMLRDNGVAWWKRTLMYLTLRLVGKWSWNNKSAGYMMQMDSCVTVEYKVK